MELEQAVAAFEATIEISGALGGQTDLQTILELIAKRGRALVSARLLVIELLRDGQLVVAAGAGELPEGLIGEPVKLEESVAGAAIRTGRTQRLADELNRSRYEQHGLGRLGVNARDALVVPLDLPQGHLRCARSRSIRSLAARSSHPSTGDCSRRSRRVPQLPSRPHIPPQPSAVARASPPPRPSEAAGRASCTTKRSRALANLRLILSAARRSGQPEQIKYVMNEAIEQLESDIASLRALITDLRPAALDQLGLAAAIEALAERLRRAGSTSMCTSNSTTNAVAPRTGCFPSSRRPYTGSCRRL